MPAMAHLSTHVLDTSRGTPADGVAIDLHIVVEGRRQQVTSAMTNADGRTPVPLMSGEAIAPGQYELTFHVADYFKRQGVVLAAPPFLDDIVIRFGIADTRGQYHVPLLVSPYGYSTYRGS